MRNLSKSKLVAFDQCPKRLWLEVHNPAKKLISPQTQTVFDTGNKVGELAQRLYDGNGDGTLINPFAEGWQSAFRRTERLVNGNKPIFEAAFTGGGVLALADVMLPAGDGTWNMVEVKSSTTVKEYHRLDVAVQMHAAKAAGIKLNKIALACIDSSWVYQGGEDYRGLLYETDLTAEASENQPRIERLVSDAQQIANRPTEPDIAVGPQCSEPFDCYFFGYCTRNLQAAENSVSWLPNVRTKELKQYILANDVAEMEQVPDALLNEQQLRVKQATANNQTYFDAEAARAAVNLEVWPAYFIDFETINLAIPIWAGTSPYEQVPYQFSNHVVDEAGISTHHEFLDISGNDPRYGFCLKLIETCGDTGPIYVFNISFERRIIVQLADQFDEFAVALNAIGERLVDLLPIAQQHYYHPSQQGSWSIKKLLPAIAPSLSYGELDGVQDGGVAMQAFEEAIDPATEIARKTEIEQQLLKYCELDTYAMVAIWKYFAGLKS